MRIAVLGTGVAGRTLAGAFAERGHDVVVGTRDVDDTLARTDSPSYAEWAAEHPDVRLVPFAEAGTHAEVVINATSGTGSLAALEAAAVRDGTVVLDASNPLDFSQGFPPTLSVANTDSLAEQLQRAVPQARVVKSLNTTNAAVMVDPALLPGEHNIFVAGDDAAAKAVVNEPARRARLAGRLRARPRRSPRGPVDGDVPADVAVADGRRRFAGLQHPGGARLTSRLLVVTVLVVGFGVPRLVAGHVAQLGAVGRRRITILPSPEPVDARLGSIPGVQLLFVPVSSGGAHRRGGVAGVGGSVTTLGCAVAGVRRVDQLAQPLFAALQLGP